MRGWCDKCQVWHGPSEEDLERGNRRYKEREAAARVERESSGIGGEDARRAAGYRRATLLAILAGI